MSRTELKKFRKKLNKTQHQLAQLLGVSVKAVHSYEQGWRNIPSHVERQMLFLVTQMNRAARKQTPCWKLKKCPAERRNQCPAWEFQSGGLCWLINGTICEGAVHENWQEKMKVCRSCEVLASQLQ
jgi:DNA-binding XRE family transcriptional regulator